MRHNLKRDRGAGMRLNRGGGVLRLLAQSSSTNSQRDERDHTTIAAAYCARHFVQCGV